MNNFESFSAPAKINLFLHITSCREDGYHNIQSAFQLLAFYDTIRISLKTDSKITRVGDNANIPANEDLCVRAALALQKETGCTLGADIAIEKKIPMGSGLGGGSSNAATVLLALNKLWQLNLPRAKLIDIGVTLGADVPVFIFGQTAWAEGVGEILSPVKLPQSYQDGHFVVLTPQVHVSTAKIFANPRLTKDTKTLKIADFSDGNNSSLFRNDLEKLVCEEFPAVASSLAWLNQFGQASMSGSGASVFLKVNSQTMAEEILAQKPENTDGFTALGLQFHPLYELAK